MFSILALLALMPLVFTSPLRLVKRDDSVNVTEDIATLNYALTLEHLEDTFYREGLNNFTQQDFDNANFSGPAFAGVQLIASHEALHVKNLTDIITSLGGTPVPACNYSFPYTNVAEFLTISAALENTGVSAYDGAIVNITMPALKTGAASIATTEGRHAAFLNMLNGRSFAAPYDTALDMQQVVSIAAQFIVSCPYNLTIVPFPKLQVYPANLTAGQVATLDTSGTSVALSSESQYCGFVYGLSQTVVPLGANFTCQIPYEAIGNTYLFLLDGNYTVSLADDSHVLAGPAVLNL